MDRLVVRILPIVMNLYIIISTLYAMNGIDISVCDYWLSCSIGCGILLSVLVHSQGKYHCKWVRVLCYNLIFVPAVSYVDSMYPLFNSVENYIFAICIDILAVTILTIGLAIHHFIKVRRVIKQKRICRD